MGEHNGLSRRACLKVPLIGAGAAIGGPWLVGCSRESAAPTPSDLAPYNEAGIDWKAASGTAINIALIPSSYFTNLKELLPQFTELTGVNVTAEEVPPQKIRENVVRDLSTGAGQYHTHAADPMYYPLYVANQWVEPLDTYLADSKLTNAQWYNHDDIFQKWRDATAIDGVPYGVAFDGEVTVQVYRKDLFDKAGLKPAETVEEFRANAEKLNDPNNRMWGTALRGLPGAGQNMYIFSSLFRSWGASWFDASNQPSVSSAEAVASLDWYVDLLTSFAPTAVTGWNWPDIADAFARGTLASYIDAHSSAAVLVDPTKSTVADKLGFARWPKGPSGKRVTSIWNWSFPINAKAGDKEKIATWLFIQWATCDETQRRTSVDWNGKTAKRSGVNRSSIWEDQTYADAISVGDGFVQSVLDSLNEDTDIDWRPRVPQWPAIGDKAATLVQGALTKQQTSHAALTQLNSEIATIMKAAR